MDVSLDPLSPVPLYQQLRDQVVLAIARGGLRRGDALLSVRRLAAAFGVNPATIAKGYDLLRSEGLVETNAKSGTFVARSRDDAGPAGSFAAGWEPRLEILLAEARAQGMAPESVRAAVEQALASLADPPGRPMSTEEGS